jgi:DNA end-binding protein Ku
MKELDIEKAEIQKPELQLALQLIDQISEDSYDPAAFTDEEHKRILAAIDDKIAGKQIVVQEGGHEAPAGGQIIDLTEALRASLAPRKAAAKAATKTAAPVAPAAAEPAVATKERKGAKRAAPAQVAEVAEMPARARARK